MGLDNGIEVCSKIRSITIDDLPKEIKVAFPHNPPEILYWRKNWGLRNAVVDTFPCEGYDYIIDTPAQVFKLIEIIVSFMNKEKWETEGDSIWRYEDELPVLQENVMNLAIIAAFMKNNPDIYLSFYDSY